MSRKYRKIGLSGTSKIITLPKDWVDLMELKAGDYVTITTMDKKLVVEPV